MCHKVIPFHSAEGTPLSPSRHSRPLSPSRHSRPLSPSRHSRLDRESRGKEALLLLDPLISLRSSEDDTRGRDTRQRMTQGVGTLLRG